MANGYLDCQGFRPFPHDAETDGRALGRLFRNGTTYSLTAEHAGSAELLWEEDQSAKRPSPSNRTLTLTRSPTGWPESLRYVRSCAAWIGDSCSTTLSWLISTRSLQSCGARGKKDWHCMVEARMAAQAAGMGQCDVWTSAARKGGPAHREWSLVGLSGRGALSGADTLPYL